MGVSFLHVLCVHVYICHKCMHVNLLPDTSTDTWVIHLHGHNQHVCHTWIARTYHYDRNILLIWILSLLMSYLWKRYNMQIIAYQFLPDFSSVLLWQFAPLFRPIRLRQGGMELSWCGEYHWNSELVKQLPLSVTTVSGSPNWANFSLHVSITAVEVVWIASIHFEWASITILPSTGPKCPRPGFGWLSSDLLTWKTLFHGFLNVLIDSWPPHGLNPSFGQFLGVPRVIVWGLLLDTAMTLDPHNKHPSKVDNSFFLSKYALSCGWPGLWYCGVLPRGLSNLFRGHRRVFEMRCQ